MASNNNSEMDGMDASTLTRALLVNPLFVILYLLLVMYYVLFIVYRLLWRVYLLLVILHC